MLDFLMEPFQYNFMLSALAVSIGIGLLCPMIGSNVVTRRLAFMGDALTHTVLPGLVLGYIVGVNPLLVAIPTCVVTAIFIGYLSKRTGLSEDTSIGIIMVGLFSLGLIMISVHGGSNIDLEGLLLGELLGVSNQDLLIIFTICIITLTVLFFFHKELVFNSFDPEGALVIGLPSKSLDYLVLILIALAVVASIQAVGVVLMLAMLVIPSATAYLIARSFGSMMFMGSVIGVFVAICGLYLSYFMDLPSGPSMALTAVLIFILVASFNKKLAR